VTVAQLIIHLKKFPMGFVVWNENEGMPTPISEVNVFDEGEGNVMIS
jgi:hypothetical protein